MSTISRSELNMPSGTSDETEPLIRKLSANAEYAVRPGKDDFSISSGSTLTKDDFDDDSDSEDDDDEAEIKKKREERLKETGGWIGYLKDFGIFVPYLVPRKDFKVQLCLLICLV